MKKHKAISVIELLVAIMIMAVLASSFALAPQTGKQTAQREAERIAAYLIGLTHEFGSKRKNFELKFDNNNLPTGKAFSVESESYHYHGEPTRYFYLSNGCYFTMNNTQLTYRHETNMFVGHGAGNGNGGTMAITDSKENRYYVRIAMEGGRIMASKDPPDNWGKD